MGKMMMMMMISFNNIPMNIIYSLFIIITIIQHPASSTAPEDPIRCTSPNNTNCTITNSYGSFPDRSTCRASNAAYPTNEKELIAVVADTTRERRKMKVATRYSHTIPKLVCPDGEDGLLVSTKYLDRVLVVDKEEMTMSVESGVTLRKLIEEAAKAGMALPYTPYWWGLTVGGMLGTGAHGSSLWGRKGSAIHDYVVEITLVSPGFAKDGYVKVRTLKETDDEINAAKLSLGVLGVISKVTLKLQSMFKRSLTYVEKDDNEFGDEAITFGRKHEFADFTWFPSQGRVIYRMDNRVPSNTSGNGINDFIPFRSTLSLALAIVRSAEETQESTKDANTKCVSGKLRTSTLKTTGFGISNNGVIFTGYPIVGYQNRLQASGTCLDSPNDGLITACPWDSRIKGEFFHQTTFSIALTKVKDFIHDVQKLVNQDRKSLCVLDQYNGILIRYVTSSSAYLGKQEDALDFDLTYYRSKDPMKPRLYEDVLEEIEQMAVFKYGALPHWGKNRNLVFDGVLSKYRNGMEFIKDGCALEGLCVCSDDSHCAPTKGYFCRSGKVYTGARVCTKRSNNSN
ncbi:Probable L-gulonolactone oxidase 6 [Linum perenne]